ncbi:hypothetical protein KKD81_00775 [Patescibacteria group bacterium]|nr:hypothetical protein [Patescibacteria group bacterium]MBU2158899.1 hypothetical protein [Patescibacteria group bacterium]MBU2220453.1 hypothetical protein [Patescibacteria group bacterium]
MPMIEGRYHTELLSRREARLVFGKLESALREAIRQVRPEKTEYGITVEGDPYVIAFNEPELRIYVFYHQEWNFTPEELKILASAMLAGVMKILDANNIKDQQVQVRFYERAGHAGAKNR